MTSGSTFGAQYVALTSAEERLAYETAEDRRAAYTEIDDIIDQLVLRALRGEQVVEPLTERRTAPQLILAASEHSAVLTEHFALDRQQARGAWYEPKSGGLQVGLIHLHYWQRTKPRFLLTLSTEEVAAPAYDHVDTVVIWAALDPLFDALSMPLRLRAGRWGGKRTAEEQWSYWTKTIEPVYVAFGLSAEPLRAFAPNSGWAELDREQIQSRRAALLEPWTQATINTARRLRSFRIGQLVDRYYAKAKDGRALRSRVMNGRAAERTLSAYFGGDWLALLNYLGEEPHAGEQVTRALPRTRLMVTSSERAAAVAAEHGLSAEEVERMLAAYWHQSEGASPLEQRLGVLKRFWREFDQVHARQAPGMEELFGLMGTGYASRPDAAGESRGDDHFSAELLADIRRLWATKLNPRWPERLVTEPYCQAAVAQTLGPAMLFWHYVGTHAWNICEGTRTHGELDDFYHQRLLDALAATGFPADPNLFVELRAAEGKLGPMQEIRETLTEEHIGAVTMSMSSVRTRRDGFEILRDIITRYRRQWSEQYLHDYLQARWREDLQAAAVTYHRHVADRAKPPTAKQFAKMAKDAASHWFAGDLTGVYGALGLPSPIAAPTYERVLPTDVRAFEQQIQACLERAIVTHRGDADRHEAHRREWQIKALSRAGTQWVELREAIGRPPELKQFGTPRFRNGGGELWADIDEGWETFSKVVQEALAEPETVMKRHAEREAPAVAQEPVTTATPEPRGPVNSEVAGEQRAIAVHEPPAPSTPPPQSPSRPAKAGDGDSRKVGQRGLLQRLLRR